jgi:hypothetical protein
MRKQARVRCRGLAGRPHDGCMPSRRSGGIPTVRLGRYYRYRQATIAAWLDELKSVLNREAGLTAA